LNKLILADCLDVLPTIEDESVDLVATDCPYKVIAGGIRIVEEGKTDYSITDPKGCLGRGRIVVSDGTACSNKWLKKGENDIPSAVKDGKMFEHNDIEFSQWLPEVFRVLKKGTHAYIMINGRNLKELQSEAEKVGFEYQNLLVWEKGNYTPNKYYMQGAEFILMLSKRPARNINNMGSKNIIKIANFIGNKIHPTEKPVSLMQILIEESTNVGDIVLDPFSGSGSTARACIRAKRNYIAIEKDESYYNISKIKIEEEINTLTLF
jgi:site-specific DNA-methyltransferase (adenine-specific)